MFREQEQRRVGRKAELSFLPPGGAAPPGFQFTLTSWLCLPGPRLPPACPGIQNCNQPAGAPYLPPEVRSWGVENQHR